LNHIRLATRPTHRGACIIRFYYHPTPNPAKVAPFLEEAGLPYEVVPADASKGEQHSAEFRAINPNGKVPAIVNTDGPGGREPRVFDSTAILLYLAEKTQQFQGSPGYRAEAERHYKDLGDHLAGRDYIVGSKYTIADMSAWGWVDRAQCVLKGLDEPLSAFPNLKRRFATVDARPAVERAHKVGTDYAFKRENDDETKRALFRSSYQELIG
jgi:GSH-dependent disulfide-bond oxidoreductase